MNVLRIVLFAVGYPTAIIVICYFLRVVRQRRIRWLAVHHVAVACIVAGWIISASWTAVGINSAWLVGSTSWYALKRPSSPVVARLADSVVAGPQARE